MRARYLCGIPLLGLLAVGLWLGSQWLQAAISYNRVMATVDTWRENRSVTSLAEWEKARLETESAIARFPGEADYYNLLGLLHEWRAFAVEGEEITPEVVLMSRRRAVNAYRETTLLRPAQPNSWAHLARLKLLAGEPDDEFRLALGNAIRQGSNDAGNLLEVAYIASLGWSSISMDEELYEEVRGALVNGMQHTSSGRGIAGYLVQAGVMEEFCPQLDLENLPENVRIFCN